MVAWTPKDRVTANPARHPDDFTAIVDRHRKTVDITGERAKVDDLTVRPDDCELPSEARRIADDVAAFVDATRDAAFIAARERPKIRNHASLPQHSMKGPVRGQA